MREGKGNGRGYGYVTQCHVRGENNKKGFFFKSPRDLSTPVFTTNNKGNLIMNANLKLIAQALGMVERLA